MGLAAMNLHLTVTIFKHSLIFQSKPLNCLVNDLRNDMQNHAIIHVKTHSQLLPFHLLICHAGVIGVEPKSIQLQALDKLLEI
jgi:hypothetical protein